MFVVLFLHSLFQSNDNPFSTRHHPPAKGVICRGRAKKKLLSTLSQSAVLRLNVLLLSACLLAPPDGQSDRGAPQPQGPTGGIRDMFNRMNMHITFHR